MEQARSGPIRPPTGRGARYIELSIPLLARLVAGGKALFSGIFGFLIALAATRALQSYSTVGGSPPPVYPFIFGGILLVTALKLGRAAFTKSARIALLEDRLVIEHPAIFKKPQAIPRAAVEVASIDGRVPSFQPQRDERFHLAGPQLYSGADPCPRWLYSGHSRSPLPLVGTVIDTPNLAVLLKAGIRIEGAGQPQRPFPMKSPTNLLVPKSTIRGFVARAKDPEAAAVAFRGWAQVRPLTTDDVAELAPSETEAKTISTKLRKTNAIIAAFIALNMLGPVLMASSTNAPAAPPAGAHPEIEAP